MITKELLEKEKLSLMNKLLQVNSILENSPEGYLICKKRGSNYSYYLRNKDSELRNSELRSSVLSRNNDIRLPADDPMLLDMAKRNYYRQYVKDLQRRIDGIEECLNCFQHADNVDLYLKKHPGIQQLVQPALVDRNKKYHQWASEPYARSTAYPENLIFITYGGFYVRSKSEQMIANKYIENGVPMRYEDPVVTPDGSIIYPDFHVYSLKYNKEYYHEHNGMMLDDEYYSRYEKRMRKLRSAGIVPGVNLIQTFEAEGNPLDPSIIQDIIDTLLI